MVEDIHAKLGPELDIITQVTYVVSEGFKPSIVHREFDSPGHSRVRAVWAKSDLLVSTVIHVLRYHW